MPTFDGDTLRITLDALPSPNDGSQNVNVQDDLYEQWKLWAQLPGNLKYPLAFRTVGGDPLTPGVDAGAYFFLQNQDGWRIISSDEDQTINYSGNLVGEDSAVSLIVPTPGRTVLHLGLQPVTQRVDEILLAAQDAAYNGAVTIDVTSSHSGTTFPVGTASNPVNNIADAYTIANRLEVKQFNVIGPLTFDRDTVGWQINGQAAVDNDVVQLAGFNFDNTRFTGLQLNGTMTGRIEAIQCGLHLVLGINGFFRRCGLQGNLSIAANADITMDSCFSKEPAGGSPNISVGANASVNIRNWSGGLVLEDVGAADTASPGTAMSVDMDPGKVTLAASCVAGTVQVRGVGEMHDNSAGTTVLSDGLLDTNAVFAAVQAVAGNADVSLDDLLVTIYDPRTSPISVLRTLSVSADGRIRRVQ